MPYLLPDFLRRAQVDARKTFIEDLYNLKSSIADILREDDKYLPEDISKLIQDNKILLQTDVAFSELDLDNKLKGMQKLLEQEYPTTIDKYKRFNNYYNKHIVKPVVRNTGLFGIQLDKDSLENKDLGQIVQPESLKLTKQIPEHLKVKDIPQISDLPKQKDWHSKLEDVTEMLKVLGEYIPVFENTLQTLNVIGDDTTRMLSLQDNTTVNLNIADASKFYSLAGQIASRMKTANLIAVKGQEVIYGLEQLPKRYFLAPTQNREVVEVLWNEYVQSGTDQEIAQRMRQLSTQRSQLVKKFRRVYEQWVVLYEETARQVNVPNIEPIQLQLVRYGKEIISQRNIITEAQDLLVDLDEYIENLRDTVSILNNLSYLSEKALPLQRAAQLRAPAEPAGPLEPGRLDIPVEPERVIPTREVAPTPPKLPVGEEFLPLVFEEDRDLYYSRGNKLTPPQAISMAGRNQLLIAMQYQKAVGTGDPEEMTIKNYTLEPYSYRTKRSQVRGMRKYFFAYDTVDGSIKMFLVGNIKAVQLLPENYSARWQVEFF